MAAGLLLASATGARADGLLVKDGDKIAFLGDSITELGNFPCGYVNLVMAGLRNEGLTNLVKIAAGRSGDRSNRMLKRTDDMLKGKPTLVFVSCGVNDVWHQEHKGPDGKHTGVDLPDFKANMREIYDRCEKAGAKPVMLTATMIMENPDDRKNKWLVPYNDFVKAEAKRRGALCIDLNAAMHRALADALDVDRRPGNKMTWDGVHPSALGNLMLSGAILRGLGVGPEIAGTSAFDCPHLEAIVARLPARRLQQGHAGDACEGPREGQDARQQAHERRRAHERDGRLHACKRAPEGSWGGLGDMRLVRGRLCDAEPASP